MTGVEAEGMQVLQKLRREFRADNRRLVSAHLRLTKGPIIDWLLEEGLVEEQMWPMDMRADIRRELCLVVTDAGEAFAMRHLRPKPRREVQP